MADACALETQGKLEASLDRYLVAVECGAIAAAQEHSAGNATASVAASALAGRASAARAESFLNQGAHTRLNCVGLALGSGRSLMLAVYCVARGLWCAACVMCRVRMMIPTMLRLQYCPRH